MRCDEQPNVAVYVLGAVDAAERARVGAHLRTCSACQETLLDFAGLPALLAHVSGTDVLALAASTRHDHQDW